MGCACRPLFLYGTLRSPSHKTTSSYTRPPFTPLIIRSSASSPLHLRVTSKFILSPFHFPSDASVGGGDNNGGGGNKNTNNPWWSWWDNGGGGDSAPSPRNPSLLFVLFLLCSSASQLACTAIARTLSSERDYDDDVVENGGDDLSVWEVKGSKWIKLIPDYFNDQFVVVDGGVGDTRQLLSSSWRFSSIESLWMQCRMTFMRLMLPEGFPHSVTSDYLDYSLWRGVQGVASQISGVLATQALLYAVGLGKGAIPTAAAINWVLKDGIGYLSKIMLSKYGRHFDVHPKGWRLFADLLENAAFGLEMLTPAFPGLFVFIGAVAGASRSAATLIQAATRSCFYAGFAAQRNFAEVIAKGEAQGMVSKFIGIMLGIALANCIGSSMPLALASFSVVTWIHMFCNLKSYQCIHLRTLNPYRASLVFSEYLLSGQAPPIKEVNDEEPLFPTVQLLSIIAADKMNSGVLCSEAKVAAADIEQRLQLGSKLSDFVNNKDDVLALFSLYKDEGYILFEHKGRFCVVLKEHCSQQDMLKSLFQVNYLYWLERNAGIQAESTSSDCRPGGRLQISLEYTEREFNHVKNDGASMGWVVDGLVARPLPNRICIGNLLSPIST